jgi:cell division protein ZapA (FtsZ GTPase activity inhibitor)
MDQLVTITLFGQSYTFRAERETSAAKAVAGRVAQEVARVEQQMAGKPSELSRLTIMILAALNLANDHFEMKTRQADAIEGLVRRSQGLIQILDGALNRCGQLSTAVSRRPQ